MTENQNPKPNRKIRWLSEKWNSYLAKISFKRIYRNSEGRIIPLLGGVIALAVFYLINYLMYTVGGLTVFFSLIIFLIFLFLAWFVIYQIKKANLRDDITSAVKRILVNHYDPYISSKDDKMGEKKKFCIIFFLHNALVGAIFDRFIEHKKLTHTFNDDEIIAMKKNIIENINFYIKENNESPDNAEVLKHEDIDDIFATAGVSGWIYIVKEGSPNNPKNLPFFQVDIEERKSSFVIFENLDTDEEDTDEETDRFYDVNTEHIIHAEYIDTSVILTIDQPNSLPKKITVSLQEWLANRNDLR